MEADATQDWWDAHRKVVYLALFLACAAGLAALWSVNLFDVYGKLPVAIFLTITCVVVASVVGCYVAFALAHWPIERIFLVALIPFGLCSMVVLGPLRIADEVDHWLAAYWYSNLLLGTDDPGHMMLRGEDVTIWEVDPVRKGDEAHYLVEVATKQRDPSEATEMVDIGSWRNFSLLNRPFWAEIVPASGIMLGRVLNLSALATYYLGRILSFTAFCILAYLSVRLTPIGKVFFAMAFLMPNIISIGGSYSWDGPIVAFSMLLTALCLRAIVQGGGGSVSPRLLIAIAIVACTLAPLKLFYSSLVLLVIAIPSSAFPSVARSRLTKALIICTAIAIAVIFNVGDILGVAAKTQMVGSVGHFLLFDNLVGFSGVMADPLRYFKMFFDSLVIESPQHLQQMLSVRLGWLDLTGNLSVFFSYIFAVLLVLAALLNDGPRWRAQISLRVICIVVLLVVVVGVYGSMLVGWTTTDQTLINGVQGRYYLPLFGLPPILLHGLGASIKPHMGKAFFMIFLACMAIQFMDLAQMVLIGG